MRNELDAGLHIHRLSNFSFNSLIKAMGIHIKPERRYTETWLLGALCWVSNNYNNHPGSWRHTWPLLILPCVFSKLKVTVLHDHWATIKNQKYTVSKSHYLRQSCLPKDALYVQGPIQNHMYLVLGSSSVLGRSSSFWSWPFLKIIGKIVFTDNSLVGVWCCLIYVLFKV